LMKMQARYTGPLKAARPPLSTTPYLKGKREVSAEEGNTHIIITVL
jgi:hypothetical protein